MPTSRGRIDRHRNGFGGDRHRVRPRHPGLGDHRRRRGHRAGHAGGALRDPRPHRRGRAHRPAARRRGDHRQRDRHAASPPPRRHGHRADRHERVRGGLRRSQPDPHRPRRRAAGRAEIAHRARHVAVGGRAARRHRDRRQARPARAAGRLDVAVPRHGAARRRDRLPRRPRRNRPRRRDRRGHRAGRHRAGDVGDRAAGRAQDGLRVPRPGHPAQGHGHGGARPVQGRPQGVGHRRQVHPRHAGLLGAARGARQPDQPDRQRCALPPPRRRALPDAVHPGRDGDRGRRAGRRDARAGCVRRGRDRLRPLRR